MYKKIVTTIAMALIALALLAPLTNVSGEQQHGILLTYGPLGETGEDPGFMFPEMNTTTFPQYVSDNAMRIQNDGDTPLKWWVFQLGPLTGTDNTYHMAHNYTIHVYNHAGVPGKQTTAGEDGRAIVEWTVPNSGPNKIAYFRIQVHPEIAYNRDNYTLEYTLEVYEEEPTIGTRSTRSYDDTVTGETTLQVGYVMTMDITYTGTQPDYVYFTQPAGIAETVPSVNNLRITNTGNAAITSFRIDATGKNWQSDYPLADNTRARLTTSATPELLNPSHTWSFASGTWPGGTNREWTFTMLNNQLGEGTWDSTLALRAMNTNLGLQADGTASLRYTGYAGDMDMTLTYSSGTSLMFPEVTPGDTDITTTNNAILSNTETSDYTVQTIEFLFAPMTKGTDQITFANNADIIIGGSYTYSLSGFTSGGIVYGRALVDLGGSGQPPSIAPGGQLTFTLKLYEVPSSTPPGSYSGNFLVTASSNPVAVFSGKIDFPNLNIEGLDLINYTITATDPAGGTDYRTGEPVTLDFIVELPLGYGEVLEYIDTYVWRIYDKDNNLLDEHIWTGITYHYSEDGLFATPANTPKNHTFTESGEYTIGLVPAIGTGLLEDMEVQSNITVYSDITPAANIPMTPLLLILALAGIAVLAILFLTTKRE